jgi:1-acyl-sn-glycerol-3-phosphate acyltransferase
MLVSNHSGGVPADGGMIIASLFFSLDPPRQVHGMVEKFAQEWPFVSQWFNRVGQLPGLPEHAIRLLRDGRLLMVFPEGARGLGKLYKDRYHLSHFGTGFMRIALQTGTPVIPLAFIGGEEAMPTVFHATRLARLVGAPYWPVPPYLLPVPLPARLRDPLRQADALRGHRRRARRHRRGLRRAGQERHQRARRPRPRDPPAAPRRRRPRRAPATES